MFEVTVDAESAVHTLGFGAISEFQQFYNLLPDGIAGPVTTAKLLQPRCGVPDIQRARAPQEANWPKSCLDVTTAYNMRGIRLAPEVILEAWLYALEFWNSICGIRLSLIDDLEAAQIWAKARRLPGTTLGWSFLSNGNCQEQLEQAYDTLETWDFAKLAKVIIHEIGHALGFEHSNHPNSIMYAYATADPLELYPSAFDIELAENAYGPNEDEPPPPAEEYVELQLSENLPKGNYRIRLTK